MPTIFWACAILFVYIYMAAVVGLVLTDPFYDAHVAAGNEWMVGGVGTMMFFLIQVMTCDAWTDPVRRLQAVQGNSIGWYFVMFNSSVVFILMNLVMAMIMESALAMGNKNEEDILDLIKRRKQIDLSLLESVFNEFAEGVVKEDGSEVDDEEGSSDVSDDFDPRDVKVRDRSKKTDGHDGHRATDGKSLVMKDADDLAREVRVMSNPYLTQDGFTMALKSTQVSDQLAKMGLDSFLMRNVFHLIDNGDGRITSEEFLDAMLKFCEDEVTSVRLAAVDRRLCQLSAFLVYWFECLTDPGKHDLEKVARFCVAVEKTIPQWFPEHYEYLKEMLAETHAGAHKGHKPGQEGQSYAEIRAERDKIKQAAMERNAENPVLRLLHGESERVKELQSEAAKADGGSDENSSGGSDKHSSKHGAPAIDGIFKDPIQAADEVRNLGKQTAQNTALESFRYLNLRYKQLKGRLEEAEATLEEVKLIPAEMFALMDEVKDCQHRLDAHGFPPFVPAAGA
jgi:hypothetical protein